MLAQCRALVHLDLSDKQIGSAGAGTLAGVLGQCPSLAHLDLSEKNGVGDAGQRVLQECWRSAQSWLTSISGTMTSKLSGKGGFELRDVAKPLDFFYRHLALLVL